MVKGKVLRFAKDPKKALFTLAWPILVAMFVQAMYNIVDTAFVGRLGAEAIAALTFAFPLFFIFIAINSGIGAGISSKISRLVGSDKYKAAENASVHGIGISLFLGVILFVIGYPFIDPVFSLLGASEAVLELSIDYMSIILLGVFFIFPLFAINNIFIGQGDTKTPMKIQVATLLLNIILDPIFIYILGFGVKGAAIATVSSFAAGVIMSVYYLRHAQIRPRMESFKFSCRVCWDIMKVGAPASLTMLVMSFYFMAINRIMVYFGTDYVAAFGVASRLESLAVMPVVAFSISLLTLTGMFYGAKKHYLLKSTIKYAVKVGVLITSLVGALFFIAPSLFMRIFTADISLIYIGASYIRVNVFSFPLIAVGMMIGRALQGMGYGVPSLVINLVRVFIVAIPLASLFVFYLGLGYLSIAAAMILGGLASSSLAVAWITLTLRRLNSKHSRQKAR
ncbi:MATE family efflux transporter [Candidatus Woesearchaeota archaeon]|nr:MATE family efflux transporter [Candidatus Woesearchaeota archaeon]